MSTGETPAHIAALLGKTVRVTGPYGAWEGRLSAYAPDPSVVIDGPGGRFCLPAAYGIEEIPEADAGEENLTRHVQVRFDRETVAQVRRFSDADGMTVSAWVRNLVAGEVARRDGKVTVSRADLDEILSWNDPSGQSEEAGAAWSRLRGMLGYGGPS